METEQSKKRGSYTTKKKLELETLLTAAKQFQFVDKKHIKQSKRNPNTIAELTKDCCLYPNRYLNNDNTCITCDLYEYCGCKLKALGKKKRNE